MAQRASFRLILLCFTFAAAIAPAAAQPLLSTDPMEQARAAEARGDSAEALSRYLRVLAAKPRDLAALTGAGHAALALGDPNAAVGFYARAEEIAPRNGRIKAGLGSALLQMNNPRGALKLFGDAIDLGVPAAEIAADRGLAYDLRGDNKRAQQDYQIALTSREDNETRRRLALSLAMSGDRVGALAALDPLLRRQDVPAWRARAFVLALTGDAQGAETTALSVMPRPQVMALLPYLTRLRTLKPAQQAAAVHLGRFPADVKIPTAPTSEAFATRDPVQGELPATGAGRGLIPMGQPLGSGTGESGGPALASRDPAPSAPRRRPGAGDSGAAKPGSVATDRTPAAPTVAPTSPPTPADADEPGYMRLPATGQVIRLTEADGLILLHGKAVPTPQAVPKAKSSKSKEELANKGPVPLTEPQSAKAKGTKEDAAKSKSDSRDKGSKSADGDSGNDKADAKAKTSGKNKDADKDESRSAAKGKGAERYWVQVAGGANKADLPKAFAKLKDKSPQLLAGRSAWTTRLRATNRLLVGPFKTLDEAQAFVNRAGKSLPAFTYTSPPGQEVEKLSAK